MSDNASKEEVEELKMEVKRLQDAYAEELKRKDKIIEELKEQNAVLFKSALKTSTRVDDLLGKLQKAMKKSSESYDKKEFVE
jgi:hypothetical protein